MLGGAKAALPLGGIELAKMPSNLPISLLIGGKGGCIPPNRREGRFSPKGKGHALFTIHFYFVY